MNDSTRDTEFPPEEWYDDEVRINTDPEPREVREKRLAELGQAVDKLRAEDGIRVPWTGGGREPDGTYRLAYPDTTSPAYQVMSVVYDHGMVSFSWPQWAEGWQIYAELTPETVRRLDLITTLKLLSALTRSERFGDGTWAEAFESGRGLLLFEHWLALEQAGAPRPVTVGP